MIEEKREAISAMLDDELGGRVFDQLVADLSRDEGLREYMARYCLIGDVLRGEAMIGGTAGIAASVSERLAAEPAILVPKGRRAVANWGRGILGLAIAASVALVAVGLLSERQGTSSDSGDLVRLVGTAAVQPSDEYSNQPVGVALRPAESTAVAADNKLARYLVEHNEFASRDAANGFMSYTSFVGYDGQ